MVRVEKGKKAKIAVAHSRKAAAIFICSSKTERNSSILLDERHFSLRLDKKPQASTVMGWNSSKSSASKKDIAPEMGRCPFLVRQKTNAFTMSCSQRALHFAKRRSCRRTPSLYCPRAPPLLKSRFYPNFRR